MLENAHTNIRPQEIAERVCMSYSWFRHNFKQYTGMSPHQYILELRIKKSEELLISTSLTCQEIGYKVGYDSSEHFTTIFKRKTGLSPSMYRKKYKVLAPSTP